MLNVQNILVAKDFSLDSEQALRLAMQLASRTGARLHLVYVNLRGRDPAAGGRTDEDEAALRAQMAASFSTARAIVGLDTLAEPVYAIEYALAAAPGILDYAERHGIDVIAMGTHGRRGVRHLLLGSVAEEVVRLAGVPVLTVGAQMDLTTAFKRIIVPVDFSRHAQSALRTGKALADLFHAPLEVLHVVEEIMHPAFYNDGLFSIYDIEPDIEVKAEIHLKRLLAETFGEEAEAQCVIRTGHSPSEIVHHASDAGCGLLVLSTHGLTGLAHFFIGSVAERVVQTAPCPVLTIKSFGKSIVGLAPHAEGALSA